MCVIEITKFNAAKNNKFTIATIRATRQAEISPPERTETTQSLRIAVKMDFSKLLLHQQKNRTTKRTMCSSESQLSVGIAVTTFRYAIIEHDSSNNAFYSQSEQFTFSSVQPLKHKQHIHSERYCRKTAEWPISCERIGFPRRTHFARTTHRAKSIIVKKRKQELFLHTNRSLCFA